MTEVIEDDEVQHKADIQNVFNTVATGYGLGSCHFFHLCGQTMAELHNLNGDEQVLDLACGTGAAAIPLAKNLPRGRLTAVDFSEGMLAQAKRRAQQEGLQNIDFFLQDMTDLAFDDQSFDRINCSFGIFFVEDMANLLQHISTKLKPGGKILISGFCGDSFMPQSQLALDRLKAYGVEVPEQPAWKRMSEPEQLQELFDAAGLQNMRIERKSHGYYIDGEGWWEILWNAGFRGMIEKLGDKLEQFKQEHMTELEAIADENGIWLEIDVNFTCGEKV